MKNLDKAITEKVIANEKGAKQSLKIPSSTLGVVMEYEYDKEIPVISQFNNMVANTKKECLTKYGDLEVFFSKDPKYLSQYYKLRFDAYREENGWKEFNTMESRFDRDGRILVVTKNGKFVGGLRLMFSDECEFMSHEIPGTPYDYRKFIKKYDQREDLIVAEIAAVVVTKENRDTSVTEAVFKFIFKYAKMHGCSYVFGVAVLAASRNYRKIFTRIGYDLEIIINFPWDRKKTYGNFATLIYVKLD